MARYARLTEAQYAGDYKVFLKFADGISGTIDLSDQLWGEMFEPLKDKKFFSQLCIDAEMPVLVWPNGADLAPEFLYERAIAASSHSRS